MSIKVGFSLCARLFTSVRAFHGPTSLQPRGKLKHSLLKGGLSPAPPSSMLNESADGVSLRVGHLFVQRMFANIELGGSGANHHMPALCVRWAFIMKTPDSKIPCLELETPSAGHRNRCIRTSCLGFEIVDIDSYSDLP